jgi:hypothetical protein
MGPTRVQFESHVRIVGARDGATGGMVSTFRTRTVVGYPKTVRAAAQPGSVACDVTPGTRSVDEVRRIEVLYAQ